MYGVEKIEDLVLNNSNNLCEKIIQEKEEMNELAEVFGITHELTVAKSQALDLLIYEYIVKREDIKKEKIFMSFEPTPLFKIN